jgi:hypothetical protein
MEDSTTITVSNNADFVIGDTLHVTILDNRWWLKLYHFIMCRNPPVIVSRFKVNGVEGNTVTIVNEISSDITVSNCKFYYQ